MKKFLWLVAAVVTASSIYVICREKLRKEDQDIRVAIFEMVESGDVRNISHLVCKFSNQALIYYIEDLGELRQKSTNNWYRDECWSAVFTALIDSKVARKL